MTDDDDQTQFSQTREYIKRTSTWVRGFYIVLFAVLFYLAEIVIAAVVVFQFLHTLLTGKANARLLTLGQSISTYAYQILAYISYNSDHQPYPFGAWPKGAPSQAPRKRPAAEKKTSETETDQQDAP